MPRYYSHWRKYLENIILSVGANKHRGDNAGPVHQWQHSTKVLIRYVVKVLAIVLLALALRQVLELLAPFALLSAVNGKPKPVVDLALCGPHLLGIGTQKGGTTALDFYLRTAFRDVVLLPEKCTQQAISSQAEMVRAEAHFFDDVYSDFPDLAGATDAYLLQYGIVSSSDNASSPTTCSSQNGIKFRPRGPSLGVDISPSYLYDPLIPQRVRNVLPTARFVALLRNPTKRAISQFSMQWNRSNGTRDYYADMQFALNASLSHLNACFAKESMKSPSAAVLACYNRDLRREHSDFASTHADILWRGLYVEHLKAWMGVFAPERFLIWSSSSFQSAPLQHILKLARWLAVEEERINLSFDARPVHQGSYPPGFQIPPDLKTTIDKFYAPFNAQLFSFLEKHGFVELSRQLREGIW